MKSRGVGRAAVAWRGLYQGMKGPSSLQVFIRGQDGGIYTKGVNQIAPKGRQHVPASALSGHFHRFFLSYQILFDFGDNNDGCPMADNLQVLRLRGVSFVAVYEEGEAGDLLH